MDDPGMKRLIGLYGTAEAPPDDQFVECGALSLTVQGAELRQISFAGAEAVRSIAFVIRDEDWGTRALHVSDTVLEADEAGFRYAVTARADGTEIEVSIEVTGSSKGELAVRGEARAQQPFLTNRTGFAVLHPIEGIAGAPATVVGKDGIARTGRFPEFISPGQPFFDIQSIRHAYGLDSEVEIRFEGDIFEMEDQRNWTDASYKTYCRPLSLPFPYEIGPGEPVRQSIELSFSSPQTPSASVEHPVVSLDPARQEVLPELALAFEPGWAPTDWAPLADIRPVSLLSRIDVAADPAVAVRAIAEAHAALMDAVCELEIVLEDDRAPDADLKGVSELCREAGISPQTVIALPRAYLKSHQPSGPWPAGIQPDQALAAARGTFPQAAVGAGMLTYFTEFNRCPPPQNTYDFATHGTTAIVHAADDHSVMETLEALPHVFRSARSVIGTAEYRLGLVSIGMRTNPYGSGTKCNAEQVRLAMAHFDPRQRGLFGAAWTLGALAATEGCDIKRIAVAAPAGPFGLVHKPLPVPQPDYDERATESVALVYPVYHLLRGLAQARGGHRLRTRNTAPGRIAAFAHTGEDGPMLWLANLGNAPETVVLDGIRGAATILEAAQLEAARAQPDWFDAAPEARLDGRLALDAYAMARLRLAE